MALPPLPKEREYLVTLPRRDNDDHPISATVLEGLVRQFAEQFGGVTIYPLTGGCYTVTDKYGTKGLQCEENLIVMAVETKPEKIYADDRFVKTFAKGVGKILGQEYIMEQEELATRTWFRKGVKQQTLAPRVLQGNAPPPEDTFTRLLYTTR